MELSLFLDLITLLAVTTGILFGLLQLRHYHLSRKREATLLLLNSFQTKDFFEGILIIQELPSELAKAAIEDRVGEEIGLFGNEHLANIGILTFNHEVSIDTVHDAHGGRIVVSWQKLEQYVTDLRVELQRKSEFEWFQWLAERMMENEKAEPPIPAYLAHSDWQ